MTILSTLLKQKKVVLPPYFSREIRLPLTIFLFLLAHFSIAQISSTSIGGDWSSPSTWVGGVLPTSADDVVIAAGSNVVIRSPYVLVSPALSHSLTLNGTLTMGSGSSSDRALVISNFLLINSGGILTNDGTALHSISIGGDFTNNGTFNAIVASGRIQISFNGAGAQVIDGSSSTQNFQGLIINKPTGQSVTTAGGVTSINASAFTQTSGDFVAPSSFTVSGNMTLTSGVYTAGTNTSIGGNFTRNGSTATFTAGSGTVTFNGTSQTISGTVSPVGFNNLVTSASANVLANYDLAVGGNLSIGSGTSFTVIGYNLTVTGTTTIAGNFIFSTSTAGTKTFGGLLTIASGGTWNNSFGENARIVAGITNNGTFTSGTGQYLFVNDSQINGTFDISNVSVESTFILTNNGTLNVSTDLGGGGTLQQGLNSTLNVSGTTSIAVISASSSTNTVNYSGGNQAIKGANYSNLILSGSGVKSLNTSTSAISGDLTLSGTVSTTTTTTNLTIGGNLSIGDNSLLTNGNGINTITLTVGNSLLGGGTLSQTTNSILTINGGSTSTLAQINAAATPNTVNYNGASPKVTPGTYRNLFLNQPTGNALLYGNTSVAGNLTLNSGNLDLANNNLTLDAASNLVIASPSATKMIITSGSGELRKNFNAVGSFTFPIGDASGTVEYTPVTVNVTAASAFSGSYIGASVVDDKFHSNSSTTDYLTRYWNISQSGISNCVATVTASYVAQDLIGIVGNTVAGQLTGTFNQVTNGWKKFTALNGSLTAAGAILATGEPSVFTGITGANPTVIITGGGVSVCSGTDVPLSTTATGTSTIVYTWSPATGLSAINVANPIASPATTTTYTVTIYDGNGGSAFTNTIITANALPAEKVVTDPSTCLGTSVNITLVGSVSGVNYQLRADNDDSLVGTAVAGTGSDIKFPVNPSFTTTYNVLATLAATSCSLEMADKSTVTVNTLPSAPIASATSQPSCSVATGEITVSSNITDLTFSIDGSDYTNTTGLFTGLVSGDYTVTAKSVAGCISLGSAMITINPATGGAPSVPVASATLQPTCSDSTGTITVSSDITGLSFSIDGSDYSNTTGIFTGLVPNDYTVTAKSAAGCISAPSSSIAIDLAVDAPSSPIASATLQPTCSVSTGTITISSSLTGLTFSVDGSDYTNTTGVFTGLAAGTYTVTAKNVAGCISPASSGITITAQPATPSAPTATVTAQPTCSLETGTLTVSSTLTGLTFSVDGSAYTNTTGVFTGLTAGTYTVTAKNGAGCISLASSDLTINAQPATPVAPAASATAQPTCSVATGTITVSSSLTGLTFSVDGSDYTNTTGVFTGLAAGTYTVTAKNVAGCISPASSGITITAQPATPSAPTATVTAQPTCSLETGTLTVSSTLTGLTFSVDGSAYTNTTGVFTGLTAGTYTVTAKNGAGCISQASSDLTITAQPAAPSAPTATVTAQPTCSVSTGTLTVSSSLTGLTFSVDGSDYTNTTGVFTGLFDGTYTVTAKNDAGCISQASSDITIIAQPATPVAPVASATAQPTCSVATGTITVSSDVTGLTFSIDGSDYSNTTGVFTGLVPNDYTVTAKSAAGCISAPSSSIAIDLAVDAPSSPIASATLQPTCSVSTGTITVSSDLTDLSFSLDGSDFTNTTGVFTELIAGNYTITAKNGSGCVSPISSIITINAQPDVPSVSLPSASLCIGATMTASPTTNGTWVSNDPSIATIDNAGLITGISAGAVTFTFTLTVSGCSVTTSSITVHALPTVTTSLATMCSGTTMTSSPAGGTWVSNTPGVATINSTTGLITGVSAGTVTFTFTSTATGCSNTTATVTVSPSPEKPVITVSNVSTDTPTLTSSSNIGNQWFKDNVVITGVTGKTLTVSASGSYTVQVTSNGCVSAVSEASAIVITGIEQRIMSGRSAIYPNPAKEVIQIDWSDFASESLIEVKIYDQLGRLITSKVVTSSDNSLDVRSLVQGPYVLLARQNTLLMVQRFIKE